MTTAYGTLVSTFDTEWEGVIKTVAPKHFRGFADETIRQRLLLSMMRRDGRIKLNASGPLCVWDIKYAQQTVQPAGDASGLNFTRTDLYKQAALNWRGYITTDLMSEKEYYMNSGPGQIINRYSEIIPSLMESMTDYFGGQLFVDGNASGNDFKIHGLESCLNDAGNCVVGDVLAKPSDTYAGLSTLVGNEGGTWSTNLATAARPSSIIATDWPEGQPSTGGPKYDYNSPKLLNWSSTDWGTSSNQWEDNAERVLSQGRIWMERVGGSRGRPNLCLLAHNLYWGFLNSQRAKQRDIIPHKESADLGFGSNTVNFEGLAIHHDFEVASNIGYLLNLQSVELASLQNVLFGYRGPDWSIRDRAWLFYVGFWGNMRLRPKMIGKLKNYAAA